MAETGGLSSESPTTLGVIDISDIIHSFDHNKSIFISKLINGKSRNLQKLLKYLNGTTTSAFNALLSFGMLPSDFFLYSKDLLVIVLSLFVPLLAA